MEDHDQQSKRPGGEDEQWGHFTTVIGC
jgi:hypothetical protein